MSGHALGLTHPHVQWVPGFLPRDETTGARGNHSSPASAEANNGWSCTSALPIVRDSFTFHNNDNNNNNEHVHTSVFCPRGTFGQKALV